MARKKLGRPRINPIVKTRRRKAIRLGMMYYYSGKPCKNGHRRERLVSTGHCVACVRIRKRAYYEAHPQKIREARLKRSYEENKERIRKYNQTRKNLIRLGMWPIKPEWIDENGMISIPPTNK